MDVTGALFRPVLESSEHGDRNAEERNVAAAIKTYRYLRVGMIVVVIALAASIYFVHRTTNCWQGSISAYYYTPARPIFVSGLIAIAVSLIIIKGSTIIEDTLLNFAGMLAPIVAFVPTSFEPPCVPGQSLGDGPGGLPDVIVRDAQNNIAAVLVAGFVGLVVAVFVFFRERRGDSRRSTRDNVGEVALLAVTAVVLVVTSWLLATDKILDYHGWSAVAMFGFLALASIANGVWLRWANRRPGRETSEHWKVYSLLYIVVGAAMLIAGLIIKFGVPDPWDHRTLVLEVTEIGLFAAMWAVQSHERWGKILQTTPTSEPQRAAT